MTAAILSFLGKALDALKAVAAFLFIRRATKIEADRDVLQKQNEVQKNQLKIGSGPLPDADAVRKQMRDDKL